MSQIQMSVLAAALGFAVLSMAQVESPSCPGETVVELSSTVCCVGGSLSLADVNPSTCPGWPICTGTGTVSSTSVPANPPLTCVAVLDVNDPSYSSLLASVTASIDASGTIAATTINPTASPGGSSGDSSSVMATSTNSQTSGTGSSASSTQTNDAVVAGISSSALGGLALVYAIGVAGALL